GLPVVVAQVIGYSKKMDVYYPRLGVFVFSLKSRKNKTENSDIIYATVVNPYIYIDPFTFWKNHVPTTHCFHQVLFLFIIHG
ncbi:hypothetical protein, partial [Ureibacillus thermosphaericus]|uniref:hypothetical protein n=1 Tax=Ureibacillus thermosphaericus TaxID=51173 RepID=UPI0030C968BE